MPIVVAVKTLFCLIFCQYIFIFLCFVVFNSFDLINNTDHHDITDILLSTIIHPNPFDNGILYV
jgi:hypothetical protein